MRDVPQTAVDARAQGWTWMTVTCLHCRHHRDLHLDDVIETGKPATLGVLARKLSCGKCRGRVLEFALGASIGSGGKPWAEYRRIGFSGDTTVRPPRE